MMMRNLLLVFSLLLFVHLSLGQVPIPSTVSPFETDIDDIRLRNNRYGSHTGRVEVQYNGTWGTICDDFWSFSDAAVACRMLGFSGAVCAVSRGRFGTADIEVPIWMSNLQCRGYEAALDHCSFRGWGGTRCSHREDAGVICRNEAVLPIPNNVRVVNETTKSLTVQWDTIRRPAGIRTLTYRVSYQSEDSTFPITRTVTQFSFSSQRQLSLTLVNLPRGTQYTIRVRAEVRYSECFSSLFGNYSDPVIASTALTGPRSNIPVRLIPPVPGLDFMGRVEVRRNNVWGTVCDDFFTTREGNVICSMLNHTRAACVLSRSRFGRGTGQIWLDNVRCPSSAEILENCTFSPWGRHNCDHSDDVGVVCVPDDYPGKIENFTVTAVTANSVTLSWNPFNFSRIATTRRYAVFYRRQGSSFSSTLYVSSGRTSVTISRLQFQTQYNFTIRAEVRFTRYCFTYMRGVLSDVQTAMPQEQPPTCPPSAFHVTVLNCTSVRAEWNLPQSSCRNGFIRGYKLIAQPPTGDEMVINVSGNRTNEYIMKDLTPSTRYVLTILAYTVGDGPRSIHLTVETNPSSHCHTDLINFFGLNGNGLDRATLRTFQRNIHIHCGSSERGVQIDWYFPNGTKVGVKDRNVREGHFTNGTTTLQIANSRGVSYCDGGVYTCRANQTTSERAQQKTFTIRVNTVPPAPSRPRVLATTGTTVTVSWNENECNGGHRVTSFRIRYGTRRSFYFRYLYINVPGYQRNYTIRNLSPRTTYSIGVSATSSEFRRSSYSASASVMTPIGAPSPPRITRVELLTPILMKVTWRRSSISRGQQLVSYKVYATPLVTQVTTARGKRQTDTTPRTVTKVFPASASSGNMTLPEVSVTYQVQITALVRGSDSVERETQRSAITSSSTLFVPLPGLPVPRNLRTTSVTNSSVSLQWNAPPPPADPVSNYRVTYSANVDGLNKDQVLVMYTHEGNTTTTDTRITVQPLVPSSSYLFKVSAMTARGQGAEVTISATTSMPEDTTDKFVYFHIRFGPVTSCLDFRASDIQAKQAQVKKQLVNTLRSRCNCNISSLNIQHDSFSCGQLDHLILYRGQIFGSNDFSSSGLTSLMQLWVSSNQASLMIDSFRMPIDPTCPTQINTLTAPDCPLATQGTQHHIFFTTTSPSTPSSSTPSSSASSNKPQISPATQQPQVGPGSGIGLRPGEVGGIIVGVVIIILLLLVLIVIVGIVMWKLGKLPKKLVASGNGNSKLTNEDVTPFADLETSTNESNLYEEKIKY